MATLAIAEEATGGSGLAASAIVLIHFLPSFLFAHHAGAVADSRNRVDVLIWSSLFSATAAGLMALAAHDAAVGGEVPGPNGGVGEGAHVTGPVRLAVIYALLLAQYTGWSFYSPARAALLPLVVPDRDLPTATTLDAYTWSLTQAFGSVAGGAIAAAFGTRACFLLVRGADGRPHAQVVLAGL